MEEEINKNYFSIIIPLFNKEEYIERAIQSILNQTYQNFEIIVVNDGSFDGSESKVLKIKDKRIVLINQQNSGVAVARNKGVDNAQYELLSFLDADDIWHTKFLEEANLLVNKFSLAGIYGLNNSFEMPNGKVIAEKFDWLFNGEKYGIISDYFELFVKLGRSPFSNSNFCIQKKVFKKVGGYKAGVRLTEDSDLWCRIALKYDIAFLTKPLATYYIGTKGSTHFLFEQKDFQVVTTLKNALITDQVETKFKKSVKKFIAFQEFSLIKRSILTGNKMFAIKKIFSLNFFLHYPIKSGIIFIISLIPTKLILILKKNNF